MDGDEKYKQTSHDHVYLESDISRFSLQNLPLID